MTIKVSKPAINIREKLNDLDFDKVPFQKMPAGSVLQVQTSTLPRGGATNEAETTSTSPQASLFQVTIAPNFADSKILVTVNPHTKKTSASSYIFIYLYRSIDGGAFSNVESGAVAREYASGCTYEYSQVAISYMDTPNTTLPVTYKLYFASYGAYTVRIGDNNVTESMMVQEIAQ